MNPATPSQRPRLALFDLDHTLIPMDSDHGWGEFAIAIGWCDRTEFGRRNDEFFAHYQAGTLNVPDYVRFATEAIVQRGAAAAQGLSGASASGVGSAGASPATGLPSSSTKLLLSGAPK